MTNEEAIEILNGIAPMPRRCDGKSTTHLLVMEALEMAIKALEQQPCEDCISRRALLDNLEKPMNWTDSDAELQEQRDYEGFVELVKSMPSVQPQLNKS